MMTHEPDPSSEPTPPDLDRDRRLGDLVTKYMDRLNDGQRIDVDEILLAHSDVAGELLDQLSLFVDLDSLASRGDQPLGTLGDYTLRRQIGHGGMGVVYEAWENSMDRAVALKVLPAGIAADDRAFQRFLQEAKTAGKLSHPNVVPVYFTGVREQTPFYAMELVEGETLAQLLARIKNAGPDGETPFGKKSCVEYFARLADAFAEVADGLQHAHSRGVTHRDIKPSNLILTPGGQLRILDFGLAHLEGQESLTLSGDFVGTPLYMSPEQARRKKVTVDHRTDIYSLGATIYEALCGRPPFRGKDHADTLSQIIERDPPEPRKLNPRVPHGLATIVLKCLRKDAGDRYGTAEALGQDLRRFVRGDAVEARPEAGWERAIRGIRRQAWRIAGAAVLSVLVVAVLWLAWEFKQANRPDYEQAVTEAMQITLRQRLAGSSPLGHRERSFVPPLLSATYGLDEAVASLDVVSRAYPDRPDAPFWQARGLLLLENAEAAREALRRAVAARPDFAPARRLLSRLAGASEDVQDLEDRGASSGWTRLWSEAESAREEKEWARAVELYDDVIRLRKAGADLPPGIPVEIYLERGAALTQIGRYDEAVVSFAQAEALAPGFLEPELLTAKVYWLRGERGRAEKVFEELHDRSGESDVVVRSILVVLDSLGEYARGIEWTRKLNDAATRARLLCYFHEASYHIGQAIEAGREAVRLEPEEPANYPGLLFSLDSRIRTMSPDPGRDQLIGEVRGYTEKLLELCGRPGGETFRAPAWNFQAMQLFRDGQFEDALAACDRAIELDPGLTAVKAWLLARLGRFAETPPLYERVFERVPHHGVLRGAFGRILGRLGEHEKQIEMFEQYRDRQRESVRPYDLLVPALIRVGRYREALRELNKLAGRWPERVERFQSEVFRAFWKAPDLAGQSDEARALLATLEAAREKGSQIGPGGLTLLAFLRLHVGRGTDLERDDISRALADASKAVELTERCDAEALAVLAECQMASGDSARGVRSLQVALELPGATRRHAELLESYRDRLPPELFERVPSETGRESESPRPLQTLPDSWRSTGVLRINCGGNACEDADGKRWQADAFFLGGTASGRWPPPPDSDPLHHWQRVFPEGTCRPAYRIPLPRGTYEVTLDFVENFFGRAGLRSFNVALEDGEPLPIGDVFARVGHGTVESRSRTLRVDDGALDIRFLPRIDSPMISAITVRRIR